MWKYWKSPEGESEYRKIDRDYPKMQFDDDFALFLTRTAEDPNRYMVITRIDRCKVGTGEEYLVYGETIYGRDGIGNTKDFTRYPLGVYPIPDPVRVKSIGEDNQILISTASIAKVNDGYSIPFNEKNLNDLHQKCNDKAVNAANRTKYYVMLEGGNTISIPKYEDLRDLDFEILYEYGGQIPSEEKTTKSKK